MIALAALTLACLVLGGLLLAMDSRLKLHGIVGAFLVSTGCWGCLLLAYLVGSR